MRTKWGTPELIQRIEQADDILTGEIIQAVIRRHRRFYPDWELVVLSLPKKDVAERKRILESILKLEQQ